MITIEKLINNNKEQFAVCNLGTKRIEIQHDMIADKYILVTKHKRTVKTEFQLNENDLKKVQTKINKLYQQTIDDLVASGNPIPPMYFQVNESDMHPKFWTNKSKIWGVFYAIFKRR